MRSTDEYGEPVCLSLLKQLESEEHSLISSDMMRTLDSQDISSFIMRWKEASNLLSSLVGKIKIISICWLYASYPTFLYKREIKLYVCILERLVQGTNVRKVISEVYTFSALSLGGKVNTKRMSQADRESIFTKKIYEIFWSLCEFSKLSKLNA